MQMHLSLGVCDTPKAPSTVVVFLALRSSVYACIEQDNSRSFNGYQLRRCTFSCLEISEHKQRTTAENELEQPEGRLLLHDLHVTQAEFLALKKLTHNNRLLASITHCNAAWMPLLLRYFYLTLAPSNWIFLL